MERAYEEGGALEEIGQWSGALQLEEGGVIMVGVTG